MSQVSPTASHSSDRSHKLIAGFPTKSSQNGLTPASSDAGGVSSSDAIAKGEHDAGAASLSRCLVYCRLRPSNKSDFSDGAFNLVSLRDKRVVVKDERHYDFDGTFQPDSTQTDVFESVAMPCIRHAFDGFCSALLCYGQTGTGKTYTMCNTESGKEGIIPRAARHIFDTIAKGDSSGSGRLYSVEAQFVQIYRDHLSDLMSADGRERVEIHFEGKEGVSFLGCSSHVLLSTRDFMRLYTEGNARRMVTATAMNPESSRGHTALSVKIFSEDPRDPAKGRVQGKITFIDLAGYERFSKTGITSADPIMKDEAKTINASLLSLGHVVSSLSSRGKHIPWRNSKLTRILQDSIGGRSRTSIILTVGPSSRHLHETTNTLQFGMRAMAVKVEAAKVSVTVDYVKLTQRLMRLLDEKDAQIGSLELQIASRGAERQELLTRYEQDRADLESRYERDLAELQESGASEDQIKKLQEVYRAEAQNLQDQQSEEIGYQEEQHSKEIERLINEQRHQEAKSLSAMKLAQERIVEDFQRKLDSARGGTNDDLLQALRQLSEKDAVLASRANDTARLHAQIEALAAQVTALGGTPATDACFPETFLDTSQVEEIQARLCAETERQREKVIDLRAQVDRLSTLSNERATELKRLHDVNEQLGEQLTSVSAGAVVMSQASTEAQEELRTLQASREHWIDPEELETLRLSMQSDIDELRMQRDDLEAELRKQTLERIKARQEKRAAMTALSAMSANTGAGQDLFAGLNTNTSATARRSGSGGTTSDGGSNKFTAVHNGYRKMIQRLTTQLAESSREKGNLANKVASLQSMLQAQAMAMTTPLPQASDDASRSATPPPSAPPSKHSDEDEERRHAEALTLAGPDVALAMQLKEAVIDSMEDIIVQQERQLTRAAGHAQREAVALQRLRAQLREAGVETDDLEAAAAPQPVDGALPVEEYVALLRELRHENRALTLRLLRNDHAQPNAVSEGAGTGGQLEGPQQPGQLEAVLTEKDNLLNLKDELLLEKASMGQYLAKLAAHLVSQVEALGLTPCGTLPQSCRELAVQMERQEQLRHRLELEEERKQHMERLLKAMHAEREHQAYVLQQTEARNRELAERESNMVQRAQEDAAERLRREAALREEAQRAAQELTDARAELARRNASEGTGVFERLLGRLMDL